MKLIIALAVVQKWGDYMKAVLLSIKPQYCELIANGKKTIEIRKTKPKLNTPFKCYIYCTKAKRPDEDYMYVIEGNEYGQLLYCGGKIIGEFVCDGIIDLNDNGNEFVNPFNSEITELLMPFSCLSYKELHDYANGKALYGWHISELKIYDKPKELSEFHRHCTDSLSCELCVLNKNNHCENTGLYLTRPPQSWCYVEKIIYPN